MYSLIGTSVAICPASQSNKKKMALDEKPRRKLYTSVLKSFHPF
jgi:hypothetical protein